MSKIRFSFGRTWHCTPDDAARIGALAMAMPIAFALYQLVPLLVPHDYQLLVARIVFSLCVGAVGFTVGCLIEERSYAYGFAVSAASALTATSAIMLLFTVEGPVSATWAWRVVMAGTQGTVVLGWGLLWHIRKRWLSRTFAWWSFLAAAIGFGFYLVGNFGLPDPVIADPWAWGVTQARGVILRVTGWPVEPILAMGLWLMILTTWRRWQRKHGQA